MTQKKILGITPARGGSKSIPYKNIKMIAGKPLIAWTIEQAKESNLIDRYVVSTEDDKIRTVCKEYGAEVINRPQQLAEDTTPTLDVLIQVLKALEPAYIPDIVVILQATSPIRRPGLIDQCIKRFIETEADSLVTGFICTSKPYGTHRTRRQDLKGFFCNDGNVYVIKADLIRKKEFFGKKMEHIIVTKEENVDIDDAFEFWLAEQILLQRLKNLPTDVSNI